MHRVVCSCVYHDICTCCLCVLCSVFCALGNPTRVFVKSAPRFDILLQPHITVRYILICYEYAAHSVFVSLLQVGDYKDPQHSLRRCTPKPNQNMRTQVQRVIPSSGRRLFQSYRCRLRRRSCRRRRRRKSVNYAKREEKNHNNKTNATATHRKERDSKARASQQRLSRAFRVVLHKHARISTHGTYNERTQQHAALPLQQQQCEITAAERSACA